MKAEVDISQITRLAEQSNQIAADAVNAGLTASANVLQARMKSNFGSGGGGVAGKTLTGRNVYIGAPAGSYPGIRTGTLRRSIQTTPVANFSVDVGTNKKYGYWLEYGTTKMAARPWVYRSYYDALKDMSIASSAAMDRVFSQYLSRIGGNVK